MTACRGQAAPFLGMSKDICPIMRQSVRLAMLGTGWHGTSYQNGMSEPLYIVCTARSPWQGYAMTNPPEGDLAQAFLESGLDFEEFCALQGYELQAVPVDELVPEECLVIED